MRNLMARIVAFIAIFPLAAAVWSFVVRAQQQRLVEASEVSAVALVRFANELATPAFLFALAAIVEILSRIADRLPAEPPAASGHQKRAWRSWIAKLLLLAAAVSFIGTVMILLSIPSEDQSGPQDLAIFVGAFVNALFEPAWLIALAAAVEYLSRIASRWNPEP